MASVGRGPVALDSAIVIYFIEQHPRYVSLLRPLFEAIDRNDLPAFTSELTLLETLVVPYRAGDGDLALRYETILTRGRGLTLVPIDRPLLRLAAETRAATSVRTPDALQLAAALATGCTVFLTNDRRLPAFHRLAVLQIEDFA
ncbi:MAG TPA: PIN domain-containing protein [Thermoanaerobaculia bacterium]|nr:PIN domain-containing protein [Thermoanaerobaculia bacterium]